MGTAIIIAACVVGGVGIIIGIVLGIAGEKFKVEIDPNEEAIAGVLPGNNCGACGFPGCSGLAAAIAKGEAEVNTCPVGGAPVAEKIGEIMGVAAGESVHMVAYVMCDGNCEQTKNLYEYTGVTDCATVKFMQAGGPKGCSYGCMGYGSCVEACPFDAIHVVNGVAVVDKENCKACEKCIKACPNNLIELIPYKATHSVKCHSNDKGKALTSVCDVGCIGCKICEKACPKDAIHVEDFLAKIDYDKCVGCGLCAAKCPRSIIIGKKAKIKPAAAKKPAAKKPEDKPAAKPEEAPKPETVEKPAE